MNQSAGAVRTAVFGRFSLSWQVWLIGSSAPQLLLAVMGNFGSFPAALTSMGSALLVAAPFIATGSRVLRAQSSRNTAWTVSLTFLITSVAIAISTTIWAAAFTADTWLYVGQIVSGTVLSCWFFILVSALVDSRKEFVAAELRAEAVRAQLRSALHWANEVMFQTQQEEIQRITQQLKTVQSLVLDTPSAAGELRGFADSIIRTQLQEIDQLQFALPESLPELRPKRSIAEIARLALSGTLRVETPVALFIATTWLMTGITINSLPIAVAAATSSGLVLWLLFRMCNSLVARPIRRAWLRSIVVILLWAVAGVFAGVAPVLIAQLPLFVLIQVGIQTALIAAVIASVMAYRQAGNQQIARIDEDNAVLEAELVRNSNRLRVFRERLRQFVHGELQSVLVAIERSFTSVQVLSADRRVQLASEIDSLIRHADQYLQGHWGAVSPLETVRDLQAIWNGILDVDVTWSDGTAETFESNLVMQNTLNELLIEVVTNAAKHDEAVKIWITVSNRDAATLLVLAKSTWIPQNTRAELPVTVVAGGTQRAVRGTGSKLFDEVCLEWRVSRANGSTEFFAILPVVHHETVWEGSNE